MSKVKNDVLGSLLNRDAKLDFDRSSETELPEDRLVSPLAGQDHFTDGQEKDEKHSHVSAAWTARCIGWDSLLDRLEESANCNHDVIVQGDQLSLVEGKESLIIGDNVADRRVLRLKVDHDKYGGEYDFSSHSFGQLAGPQFCGLGSRMANVGRDDFEVDRLFDVYKHRFANVLEKRSTPIFLRLRTDGVSSVRALLSDRYAVIDHRWVAETVRGIVGDDALISHFDAKKFEMSGGDLVKYNVLIPDSIRKESDSDYGGMESVTNSEIGTGRNKILPSVFRAICMNGCIWGEAKDQRFAVSKKHLGHIDLDVLAVKIRRSLNNAIPLLDSGIDMMLNSKELKANADLVRLTTQVARDEFSLTVDERKRLLGTIDEEPLAASAFGVANVFTRFAQHEDVSWEQQQEIEETVGRLLGRWVEKPDTFDLVDRQAVSMDVQKVLGL